MVCFFMEPIKVPPLKVAVALGKETLHLRLLQQEVGISIYSVPIVSISLQ